MSSFLRTRYSTAEYLTLSTMRLGTLRGSEEEAIVLNYFISMTYNTISTECTKCVSGWLFTNPCITFVYGCVRTGYVAPIQGGEATGGKRTGGPVGSKDTSLISTVAWPPQCSGVLIYGLAKPRGLGRWGTTLSDGIRIFVLDS